MRDYEVGGGSLSTMNAVEEQLHSHPFGTNAVAMVTPFTPDGAVDFDKAAELAERGLYDPASERDACGVGCVVAIDGRPRREVVVKGIEALKAVWHRGAVDADGKTGDGAGIHVQIPQDFFQRKIKGVGRTDQRIAVGMVFLPRASYTQQEACRTIVESEVLGFGYAIRGWRQVPVDTSVLGEKAAATRPFTIGAPANRSQHGS